MAAGRIEKKQAKSRSKQPHHDPAHIHTSIAERLTQFTFLNDPPMSSVGASHTFNLLTPLSTFTG